MTLSLVILTHLLHRLKKSAIYALVCQFSIISPIEISPRMKRTMLLVLNADCFSSENMSCQAGSWTTNVLAFASEEEEKVIEEKHITHITIASMNIPAPLELLPLLYGFSLYRSRDWVSKSSGFFSSSSSSCSLWVSYLKLKVEFLSSSEKVEFVVSWDWGLWFAELMDLTRDWK